MVSFFEVSSRSEIVASNLKFIRKQRGLRQADVVNDLDLNYRHYQDLEAGKSNPKIETLCKLSWYFKVSICQLVEPQAIQTSLDLEGVAKKFKEQFEGFPYAMGIRDSDGKIVFVNSKYCQLIGKPTERLEKVSIFDLLTKESAIIMKGHLESEKNGFGETFGAVVEAKDKNIPLRIYSLPVFLHGKKYLGACLALTPLSMRIECPRVQFVRAMEG